MTFKHHHNSGNSKGQTIIGNSMTIPNQAMSIKEIMHRHTRGIDMGYDPDIRYSDEDPTDDEDLPDPRTLDLADIQDLKDQNQLVIEGLTTKLRSSKKKVPKKADPVPPVADEPDPEPVPST